MKTLAERVSALIEIGGKGTVLDAAHRWGIPQNTLYRICAGSTPSPRAAALIAIVRGARNDITVETLFQEAESAEMEDAP